MRAILGILATFLLVPAYAYAQDIDPAQVAHDVEIIASTHGSTSSHVALAALLSLVLKFLLDAFNSIKKPKPQFKRWLPWVCSLLGIAIGIVSYLAKGSSWIDAVLISGAGPGAIVWNELLNAFKNAVSTSEETTTTRTTTSTTTSVSPTTGTPAATPTPTTEEKK